MHWDACCNVGVGAGAGCGAAAAPRISSLPLLDAASAHRRTTTRHDAGDATFFYHPTRRRIRGTRFPRLTAPSTHPPLCQHANYVPAHIYTLELTGRVTPLEYIYRAVFRVSFFYLKESRRKKWMSRTILRVPKLRLRHNRRWRRRQIRSLSSPNVTTRLKKAPVRRLLVPEESRLQRRV